MFDDSTQKIQLGLAYLFAVLAIIGIAPLLSFAIFKTQPQDFPLSSAHLSNPIDKSIDC